MAMKWIQHAIKHPGALHKMMGVKIGTAIPKKRLLKASHMGGLFGQRARLALTLSKLHHGK